MLNLNEPRMVSATVELFEDKIAKRMGHRTRVHESYNIPLMAAVSIIDGAVDSCETMDPLAVQQVVYNMLKSFNIHQIYVAVKMIEPRDMTHYVEQGS